MKTGRIGTFTVMELGRSRQKILHAPNDAEGRYDLSVGKDGTLIFSPKKIDSMKADIEKLKGGKVDKV